MLQDAENFLTALATLCNRVEEPTEDLRMVEALESTLTAHVKLIRRLSTVMTVAGRTVKNALKAHNQACAVVSHYLMGRQRPDISSKTLRDYHDTVAKRFGELTMSVAVEMQTRPSRLTHASPTQAGQEREARGTS
ncbi:hypothetical protein G4Z16_15400 [Streptomyces bathyalis]|uniref:Uncharacterized protein n=1 Tax=Streptomyces bathyalis TaxID=2710756 RepID=A0A7T1T711_9ACTN|nr:hypothetical protein [Streptomyces bathyalis]QPP07545.1 hypothetical protein G4Z16_15400 [Streptomyces bathyalis]